MNLTGDIDLVTLDESCGDNVLDLAEDLDCVPLRFRYPLTSLGARSFACGQTQCQHVHPGSHLYYLGGSPKVANQLDLVQ